MRYLPLILTLLVAGALGQTTVEVDTPYGRVRGNIVNLVGQPNAQVRSFLGLRYGRAPVGNLRFAPTQPVEAWTDVYDATRQGSTCFGGLGPLHPDWNNYNEDCLQINIHTPHNSAGQPPYPVIMYFHGGAYRSGGNVMYTGHFMAARDTVVVVVNYRLGALGWANTGDAVAKGNYGLWDQRQAMVFVQDVIASFGGDPRRVTLLGQSAGASSIGLHIVSPTTRGLFHRAIMQSGSDQVAWAFNPPELPPQNYTHDVARALNCTTADSQAMIDCLRTKDPQEISNVQENVISGWISQGFAPVVDGEGGFLPQDPVTLRETGQFNKDVDIITGHTSGDGSTYLLPFVPEAESGGWNRSMHEFYIKNRMVNWVGARYPEAAREQVAAAIQFQFTDWPYDEDPDRNRRELRNAVTDVGFGTGQIVVLKKHANTTKKAYEYLFAYKGYAHSILIPAWMDDIHGLADIPFVWGFPILEDNMEVIDEAGMDLILIFPWSQQDKQYTNYIMDLFTNFAKTGNPTSSPVTVPGGSPVTWEPFTLDNMNYIFLNNNVTEMRKNRLPRNNAFWNQYIEWLAEQYEDGPTTMESSHVPNFNAHKEIEKKFYDTSSSWW